MFRKQKMRRVAAWTRCTRFETLEHRLLLAVDWQNPVNEFDVNGSDGPVAVNPLDALLVINELTAPTVSDPVSRVLPELGPDDAEPTFYPDVDGNGVVSPFDALLVIDALSENTADVALSAFDATDLFLAGSRAALSHGVEHDTLVNTVTRRTQSLPDVAAGASGDIVVVWQSHDQDGSSWGVFAQRYNADGVKIGGEIAVNSTTQRSQRDPAVAVDDQGNFIVVWNSKSQDGSSWGVYGQLFDSLGATVGDEFLVNQTTKRAQSRADVAFLSDGQFVVSWEGRGAGDKDGIFVRRFSLADGSVVPVTDEILVNTTTGGDQAHSSVAALPDGEFIVAWDGRGPDDSHGIFMRRMGGETETDEMRVNDEINGVQRRPTVSVRRDGQLVVAWQQSRDNGSGRGVRAQRFDSAGDPIGAAILINQTQQSRQKGPTVAYLADGSFSVSWYGRGEGDRHGVFTRTFAADGTANDDEQLVNFHIQSDQGRPAAAAVNNGYVVTWRGRGFDDRRGVFARFFDTEVANNAPVITSNGGGAAAPVSVAENQTSVTDVNAIDQEGDTEGVGLTYSISGGADQALFAIDATTGVLTFNTAPDFEVPGDADANNVYEVQVTVTDSGVPAPAMTDVQDISVTVTDANDAPVITSNGGGDVAAISVAENQTAVTDVDATDQDGDAERAGLRYGITGGADAALFVIDVNAGVLTFVNAPDFENPRDADANNIYEVQVTVTDSGVPAPVMTDVQDLEVAVTDANDPPEITSNGGGDAASVSVAENQTSVTDVNATDQDGDAEGAGLTYSITGGADRAFFSIDADTGVLTFLTAPDFEVPITDAAENSPDGNGDVFAIDINVLSITWDANLDGTVNVGDLNVVADADGNNVYEVQVTVTDSGVPGPAMTDVQDISVTVTDANDAPVITSDGGGVTATVSVAENQTSVTDVDATDQDGDTEGAGLTYSISGGADQVLFAIDANTGVLTFLTAPDFENPGDADANNVYEVQVSVTDAGVPAPAMTDVQNISVTVTDVNDPPPVIAPIADLVTGLNTPVMVPVTVTDGDTPNDDLTLSATATNNATVEFDETLPGLRVTPEAGFLGVIDVTVTVSDGTTAVSESFRLEVTLELPPVIQPIADVTSGFGETTVITVVVDDGDTLLEDLMFSATASNNATVEFSETTPNVLTVTPAPDFSGVIDVTVTVMDRIHTDSKFFQITVNAPPQLDLNGLDEDGTGVDAQVVIGAGSRDVGLANLTIVDDNDSLDSAVVQLTNVLNTEEEFLTVDTAATFINASYEAATGTLLLVGNDTLANYETVLRSLRYENVAKDHELTDRVIDITVGDGANVSNVARARLTLESADLVAFAQALTDSGTTFFGAAWCPACTAQKELFQDGQLFLPFVEVTNPDRTPNEIGVEENVTVYPTWESPDGSRLEGLQDLLTLSEWSGVPIPTASQPFIAPIDDVTLLSGVELLDDEMNVIEDYDPVGSPLLVSLDGYDPNGGDLTYEIISNNPDVTAEVLTGNRSARIKVAGFGDMVFELFEDRASRATEQMIELATNTTRLIDTDDDGVGDHEIPFYQDIIFHRVINDFVIQAGDPSGTGGGGSELGLFDDQYHFDLQHNRTGLLSMAKSEDDTNNSQFFITEGTSRHLDFNHTIFGVLVEGENNRAAISDTDTVASRPTIPVTMEGIDIFSDNENAVVLLRAAPRVTGEATITLIVTDPDGNTYERSFIVTIEQDVSVADPDPELRVFGNGGPFLTDFDSTLETDVNTPIAFDLEALDVEGDAVFFDSNTIGVEGEYEFEMDHDTGVVTVTPVDDFVGTIEFLVGVRSADGAPNDTRDTFDAQSVTINVGNQAPVITSAGGGATAMVSLSENGTSVTDVNATDPDGDTEGAGLAYSVTGGADQDLFSIDVNTGVLTFITAPDFEVPVDADANNSYEVQVTVTDSGVPAPTLTDWQDISVQVEDVVGDDCSTPRPSADLRSCDLAEANLRGMDLSNANMSGANLEGADLADSNLSDADLNNANLNFVNLSGAVNFTEVQLASTDSYQSQELDGIGLARLDLSGWNFSGQDLSFANLNDANFSDANLRRAKLSGADLRGAILRGANLLDSDLTGADLSRADLSNAFGGGADLSDVNLEGADLQGVTLQGASLQGADLSDAQLSEANLSGADLSDANNFTEPQLASTASYQSGDLFGIGLARLNLSGWDFSGQDLTSANLAGANLSGANLTGADLTDAFLGGANLSGANLSDANLHLTALSGANLSDADLSGAILNFAHLSGALNFTETQLASTASYQAHDLVEIGLAGLDLSGWDFSGQDLSVADLSGANLRGANLSGAFLDSTNLSDADLEAANLSGAHLFNTIVGGANLSSVDLRGVNLEETSLSGVNLSDANLSGAGLFFVNLSRTINFTESQLASTASYQSHDLVGIGLAGLNLSGWNFSGQDLSFADLSGADLSRADLSGANLSNANLSDAVFANTTCPDGSNSDDNPNCGF